MTKRELIDALEALSIADSTEVRIPNEEKYGEWTVIDAVVIETERHIRIPNVYNDTTRKYEYRIETEPAHIRLW